VTCDSGEGVLVLEGSGVRLSNMFDKIILHERHINNREGEEGRILLAAD
jgi:hypothetical protein